MATDTPSPEAASDVDGLIELAAERMRADYVLRHQPNKKQWSEIDEGMREVWRQHARAAAEIYETRISTLERQLAEANEDLTAATLTQVVIAERLECGPSAKEICEAITFLERQVAEKERFNCGYSSGGVELRGNGDSINAVRQWHDSHCRLPMVQDALVAEVTSLRTALTSEQEKSSTLERQVAEAQAEGADGDGSLSR